jgi:hypothetical protein
MLRRAAEADGLDHPLVARLSNTRAERADRCDNIISEL